MREILEKCMQEDLEYLSQVLDSNLSFTNDRRRKQLLDRHQSDAMDREALVTLIEKQIRYYGSSDFAYLGRSLFTQDAGVSDAVLIEDVCRQLKVKIKKGGELKHNLKYLVKAVVVKELVAMPPKQLSKAFTEIGVGNADRELLLKHLKSSGTAALFPVIASIVGPHVIPKIIEAVIIGIIEKIVGKALTKGLAGELAKRNPWFHAMGPVVWGISAAWLVFDVQGPAYRKTIPAMLYLGVVAMREEEKVVKKLEPPKSDTSDAPAAAVESNQE